MVSEDVVHVVGSKAEASWQKHVMAQLTAGSEGAGVMVPLVSEKV